MFVVKSLLRFLLFLHIYFSKVNATFDDWDFNDKASPTHEENYINITFWEKYDYQLDVTANINLTVATCRISSSAVNYTMEGDHANFGHQNPNLNGWTLKNRCHLAINRIKADYPLYWEILLTDNQRNTIFNHYTAQFYYTTEILTDQVTTMHEASFMQYILSPSEMVACSIDTKNTTIKLSVDSEEVELPSGFFMENRTTSVGRQKCGFILNNCSKNDEGFYTFLATDVDKHDYKRTFEVKFQEIVEKHEVINVYPSTIVVINCESKNGFCSLFNPQAELVAGNDKSCTKTIKASALDFGVWTCITGVAQNMESLENTIEIRLKDMESTTPIVEDTADYLTIGCKINNPDDIIVPKFCKLIAPYGTEYQIQPGAATGRFSTVSLDLERFSCSIEIRKPLLEKEKGKWACNIAGIGAYVYVETSEEQQPYSKHLKRNTRDGDLVSIMCSVPYSSNYCYILAPNGTKFESDYQNKSWIGECSYTIKNVNIVDNGTWHCGFSQEMGKPVEKIYFDLLVAENMFYYQEIEAEIGGESNLLCSTQGVGLKHCIYISPTKEAFYVHDQAKSKKIDYYGKGLVHGDCGITIKKIEPNHAGRWKCISKLFDSDKDLNMTMLLIITNKSGLDGFVDGTPSLAASLGIGFGVLLIVSIGAVIFYVRKRRRANNAGNNNTRGSNNSSDIPISPFEQNLAATYSNIDDNVEIRNQFAS